MRTFHINLLRAIPHASYRLSFFYNGISFSYLIQTRNVTDGTRVFRANLKTSFVNDKTEDILMTSSKGDLI